MIRKINLIIIIGSITTFSCVMENYEQHYKDYKSLKESTLRQQSWFPEIISNDSYDFKEIHNLENNFSYGKYKYLENKYFDSIFTGSGEDIIIDFTEFKKEANKIDKPERPKWFLDCESANPDEFESIKIDDYYISRHIKSKTIYFINK